MAYGTGGISRGGLVFVVLLHATVFWALLRMEAEAIVLPASPAVLDVRLLTPPAPELPKPEIVPPKPRPVERRPEPRPVQEVAQLAIPAETPVAAPAVEIPAVPPAPTFATPAPSMPPMPTQPRFDADYLDNPKPPYPPLARKLREEGRVVLRVGVDAQGNALDVQLHASSGSERLDQSALNTVRRWKFVPARLGGEPVAASVLVPIVFSLKD